MFILPLLLLNFLVYLISLDLQRFYSLLFRHLFTLWKLFNIFSPSPLIIVFVLWFYCQIVYWVWLCSYWSIMNCLGSFICLLTLMFGLRTFFWTLIYGFSHQFTMFFGMFEIVHANLLQISRLRFDNSTSFSSLPDFLFFHGIYTGCKIFSKFIDKMFLSGHSFFI